MNIFKKNMPNTFRALIIVTILFAFFILHSCFPAKPISATDYTAGKNLFMSKCSVCHSINPPPKIAPPVRGITRRYKNKYENYLSFHKAIVDYTQNPHKDKTLMKGWVNRFGLMPKLPVKEEDLMQITTWMWNYFKFSFAQNKFAGKRKGCKSKN